MHVAFATTHYQYLLNQVVGRHAQAEIYKGGITSKTFPDGEMYHRFNLTDVEDRNVILIGGTYSAEETLELYDMGCYVVKHGARSLTMYIPYYGYSTMERAVKPGEIVKAKTRARLISTIPSASRPNRVVFLDLHTEGLPHYMEGNIQPTHLYAKELVMKRCFELAGDFVLGSTDAGRAKWIESLAKDMNVSCAIITKRRTSGTDTEITSINADVTDKTVIIYDDMIRTGGSVIEAARKYMEVGARVVHVISTHGVLPGDSLTKILRSGAVSTVTVTNSHPRAHELSLERPANFTVLDIAGISRQVLCASNHSF